MTLIRLALSLSIVMVLSACQPSHEPTTVTEATSANAAPADADSVRSEPAIAPATAAATSDEPDVEIAPPTGDVDITSLNTQLDSAQDVIRSGRGAAREVRQQIDDYLRRQGLNEGPQIKGGSRVNVLVEVASTTRQPGERGFHNSRRTAYQRAYLNALGKFLSQRAQDINNQMGSVFRDNSDNMRLLEEACAPTRDEVIAEKLKVLAEAVIDDALTKLDAGDSSTPASPPQFTCPAQEELFRTSTTRAATASLSGLRVVFSSEVNGQVGVVVVHSTKFEETARRLLSGEWARMPHGNPLAELRAKLEGDGLDLETLRGTFGTRIVTTSNGEPIVVAFGQSGPDVSPADSDRVIDRKFDSAKRQAYNEAAAELARFARTTAVFASDSISIDESGKYVDLKSGAYEEAAVVAEQLLETVETQSRLTVQGVAQVRSWEIEADSNGQPLVGVVLAWSPSLQSTFGRDAPPPVSADAGDATDAGSQEPRQHRAKGAEMEEDW